MPITSATAAASIQSWRDEQYSLSSSSSQFFMKMPTTSCPCCFSSQALTAESTPPDRPTTTRNFFGDDIVRDYPVGPTPATVRRGAVSPCGAVVQGAAGP